MAHVEGQDRPHILSTSINSDHNGLKSKTNQILIITEHTTRTVYGRDVVVLQFSRLRGVIPDLLRVRCEPNGIQCLGCLSIC